MDYKAIINLMKEMNQTDLSMLEIESEDFKIKIEKRVTNECTNPTMAHMPSVNLGAPMGNVTAVLNDSNLDTLQVQGGLVDGNAAIQTTDSSIAQGLPGTKEVVSPMVGTFYGAPSPEKPSFVKVGDKVKKGQTVCIIEAMKLMNEIECDYDGEVIEILVENEAMVEYGQPLFVIR